MVSISVELPESMKSYVEAQVSSGGYRNASDYIKKLISRERKLGSQATIEAKLLEGLKDLADGRCRELTPADWKKRRERLRRKASGKQ